MKRLLSGTLLALLVLSGCGNDEPDTSVVHDESDILEHINGSANSGGTSYSAPAGGQLCRIAVVMTDANMVDMYVSAGDVVATNPDKTAGLKITDSEAATCKDALTEALSDFE